MIDPRAIIDPTATLADNVSVGAWSVIGAQVSIGDGAVIATHVVVEAHSQLGAHVQIGAGSVLGAGLLADTRSDDSGTQGVAIGADAVVLPLSRVTLAVAPGDVVGGNPAQVVAAADSPATTS